MTVHRATSTRVACTLGPAKQREAQQAWQRLFRTSLVARTEVPGGVRIEVRPQRAEELRRLVGVERGCCSWITFELDGPVVTLTAAGAGEGAVREMWRAEAAGGR